MRLKHGLGEMAFGIKSFHSRAIHEFMKTAIAAAPLICPQNAHGIDPWDVLQQHQKYIVEVKSLTTVHRVACTS